LRVDTFRKVNGNMFPHTYRCPEGRGVTVCYLTLVGPCLALGICSMNEYLEFEIQSSGRPEDTGN
jgi:hypothetical protein